MRWKAAWTAACVSRAMPKSVTRAPAALAAASSMARFASRILPGPSWLVPGSHSSSPVDSTPTCGCKCTCAPLRQSVLQRQCLPAARLQRVPAAGTQGCCYS